jgi:hypothetical protein
MYLENGLHPRAYGMSVRCIIDDGIRPVSFIPSNQLELEYDDTTPYDITVSSNWSWNVVISMGESWCSVTPSSGNAGEPTTLTITCDVNYEYPRVAVIEIHNAGSSMGAIYVSQHAAGK